MLKIDHVTKYYDEFLALNDLSFSVKCGEIFGILGVNGSGKTTTFRIIMGLLEPSKGKVTLDGRKIDYSITDKIGFLTEERSLLLKLTVKEQCLFYGSLKGMTDSQILRRMDELLDKFGMVEYRDKKIKELSKGNQQKIQFITAILNNPKLLILDEPFSGLDPLNIELLKNEILEMSKKGSIIIFSSHRMEHVELFCEKLLILHHGNTILEGDIKEIKKNYSKKIIKIEADITKKDLEKIPSIIEINMLNDQFIVKIANENAIEDVFNEIKKCSKVRKFVVEEPSLNDIFIEKVGEFYEK